MTYAPLPTREELAARERQWRADAVEQAEERKLLSRLLRIGEKILTERQPHNAVRIKSAMKRFKARLKQVRAI